MKMIIGIALGFMFGFLSHLLFIGKKGAAYHWQAVEKYNALVNNPANWKPDPATGLSSVTVPNDTMEESLAALVDAGELSHMDLVFPNVPYSRESASVWMKYCSSHKEIVYATGNPSYTGIEITGVQPLHVNVWFRPSDMAVVQAMVRELEEKHNEARTE